MDDVIAIEGLHFAFGRVPVLEDVTLRIARGDFACVVGPNGGGKTTLLKLMLGLLEPDRGTVRVLGRPPEVSRRRVGYMPQHAHLDLQFPIRVIDVVLMGRLRPGRFGFFGGKDRQRARDSLDVVGMADLARRPFADLSGGQRQRVLIARALACDPEILLLDEPTSNLDPLVQGEMNELLNELNQRLTILLVSHDVGFVANYVKTVVCVNRGVVKHAAEDVTGDSIRDLYGHEVQLVHHQHGHTH